MWYMILFIIGLIIIGLIVNIIDIKKRIEEYNFANEYYEKFSKFLSKALEKKDFNNKDYVWLVSNSDKMQFILGEAGIISYKEYNMIYKNIPILINVMNDIISLFNGSYVSDSDIQMINWCQTAFLRKIGILDEYTKNAPKRLFNPFYDLSNGIKFVLKIPINILYSIGFISYKGKNKIEQNILFRILSAILSLLTIFSAILSIVVGWDEFLNIINNIFK